MDGCGGGGSKERYSGDKEGLGKGLIGKGCERYGRTWNKKGGSWKRGEKKFFITLRVDKLLLDVCVMFPGKV